MCRAKAFTLVEILVVVVLLGILAAVVIPSVANSGTTARAGVLKANLDVLRRFVLVYTSQHGGRAGVYRRSRFAGRCRRLHCPGAARQRRRGPDGPPGNRWLQIRTLPVEYAEESVQRTGHGPDAG